MANGEIFTINPDGTQALRLTENDISDANPQWSPDGDVLEQGLDGGAHARIPGADRAE